MTQDELCAALLLMGFKATKKGKPIAPDLRYYSQRWICKIRFHIRSDKVDISQFQHYGKWRTYTYSSEAAFNFIKEKLT